MSNLNRGKNVKRVATMRVPMIARGPVVRYPVDPILVQRRNQPNKRGEVSLNIKLPKSQCCPL